MNLNLLAFDSTGALQLLDVAIKSFVLLTVTLAAALLWRKRSAATVHRIWTLGFGGCVLIPVIALVAPSWTLPILPEVSFVDSTFNESAEVTELASVGDRPSPAADDKATPGGPPAATDASAVNKSAAIPADQSTSVEVRSESKALPSSSMIDSEQTLSLEKTTYFQLFLLTWVAGALTYFSWIVWQQLSLLRILSASRRIDGGNWATIADAARGALGLKRNVQLRKLTDARSPMVTGIVRTVVVLPSDAENWSTARRRFVLLHELAHAKRGDVLTQSIAGLVCALHWFNPLCWYGLSQMRKLREVACDDLVVAVSERPSDYAGVLLDVARSYRHRSPATAVAMARSTNVEKRIMAVLDLARSRAALTGKAARTLLALTAAIVVLVGTVRFESQAESPTEASATDEPDDGLRSFEIHINDEQGEPIAGANLTMGLWYMKDYEGEKLPREYVTNDEGVVYLRIPERLKILRLWPSKPGYVPQFMNFGEGKHKEGELIPDEYEFRLVKGHEISGRIVDREGNPVEGVRV